VPIKAAFSTGTNVPEAREGKVIGKHQTALGGNLIEQILTGLSSLLWISIKNGLPVRVPEINRVGIEVNP
jgi:hypothetical protein